MSTNRCSKVLQTSVHKVELDSIHNYYKPSFTVINNIINMVGQCLSDTCPSITRQN